METLVSGPEPVKFPPLFRQAAAAARWRANGIFRVAASEMNWIGKLIQLVSLT